MQQHYNVREIVWAKVHPYPWWPGKIVKILQQNNKTVYKVSFFADPTYTFLHESQLTPYLSFDPSLNPASPTLPQLQKAIDLAAAYYARLASKRQDQTSELYLAHSPSSLEEQKREENSVQNIIFPQQKNDKPQQQPIAVESSTLDSALPQQITLENVCEVIEANRRRQKSCNYSYQSRKQEMQLQQLLKKTLLMKYNLLESASPSNGSESFPKKKIIQLSPNPKQMKKISKERYSKTKAFLKDQIEAVRVRCLRKIVSILKQSNQNVETSKIYAIKTMKRILSLAESNRMKLQSLFITLVRALTTNTSSQGSQQKLVEFNSYLDQLQGDKHEDEVSRITQIQAMS